MRMLLASKTSLTVVVSQRTTIQFFINWKELDNFNYNSYPICTQYNIIAELENSTVVAKYDAPERTRTSYQSENEDESQKGCFCLILLKLFGYSFEKVYLYIYI